MKNIRDLEIELCDVFEQLKKDPKRVCQAKELANVAGKLIGAQKVSLDYATLHGKKQTLPFLER
jgi:hypothetical protein